MAKVKVAEIAEHLSYPMTQALEDAMQKVSPGTAFDRNALYREFHKALVRRCRTWEAVPNHLVDAG